MLLVPYLTSLNLKRREYRRGPVPCLIPNSTDVVLKLRKSILNFLKEEHTNYCLHLQRCHLWGRRKWRKNYRGKVCSNKYTFSNKEISLVSVSFQNQSHHNTKFQVQTVRQFSAFSISWFTVNTQSSFCFPYTLHKKAGPNHCLYSCIPSITGLYIPQKRCEISIVF